MSKIVAISCDHAGLTLKNTLKQVLEASDVQVLDVGCFSEESVDYPDMAALVVDKITSNEAECGIVICGSGIGISIAANRHPEIRAALCHNAYTAEMARKHNDANVLALGARVINEAVAKECVQVFLDTAYEAGRHAKRVEKLGRVAVSH